MAQPRASAGRVQPAFILSVPLRRHSAAFIDTKEPAHVPAPNMDDPLSPHAASLEGRPVIRSGTSTPLRAAAPAQPPAQAPTPVAAPLAGAPAPVAVTGVMAAMAPAPASAADDALAEGNACLANANVSETQMDRWAQIALRLTPELDAEIRRITERIVRSE